jgi:hypothetical protein
MEFPIGPVQIWPMKHYMQVAGLMVLAGVHVQAARDSRPADVTVFVEGGRFPPNIVDCVARGSVTRMYARLGVRIDWRIGNAARGTASGSPVTIQMRYANDNERHLPLDSLAFSLPFGDGNTAVTVMYNRIQRVADRSGREQVILAHVLAHEIGHILQRSDRHVGTGVMKAHWNNQDLRAMEKRPLEFTPEDIHLIVLGLAELKVRTAGAHDRGAIVRPLAGSEK